MPDKLQYAELEELQATCPDGGEHEPETVSDSLTTNFWGHPQTMRFEITTCTKCGQTCEPNQHEELIQLKENPGVQ